MNRRLYRALIALAGLLAGILVALPIWDHWYYGTGLVGAAMATGRLVTPPAADGSPAMPPGPLSHLPSQLMEAAESSSSSTRSQTPHGGLAYARGRKPGSLGAVRSAATGENPAVAPEGPASVKTLDMGYRRTTSSRMTTSQAPASSPSVRTARDSADKSPHTGNAVMASTGLLLAAAPSTPGSVSSAPRPPDPARGTPVAPKRPEQNTEQPTPDDSQANGATQGEPPHVALLSGIGVLSAGETIVVKVALIGGRDVSSIPFHVIFNPEVIEFVGAREGVTFRSSSLAPILLAGVNPERPGDLAVGLSLIGAGGLLNASGDVLELEFRGVRPGSTDMRFEHASLRGAHGEVLPAQFFSTSVTVR